jgi:catechol 2,3-dioxygenase-like lactoylglutathione lyase family enzyme
MIDIIPWYERNCIEGRMIKTRGVYHIGIPVNDMERAVKFYTEVLGMSVAKLNRDDMGDKLNRADLRSGDDMVVLFQRPHPVEKNALQEEGATHQAFVVSTEDFELAAKYRFLRFAPARPFAVALRVGGNARTSDPNIEDPYSFFAQGIATLAIGSRVHLTAVPTYISNTPRFRDVFTVPVALALAITRSVNLQGEFIPKNRDYGQTSYGWMVAVEKTVLRHRFSWTFGNMHATTVNQYAGSDELGGRLHRGNVYMGFNIVRQWKLK